VIHGSADEFCFDFLRDNLAWEEAECAHGRLDRREAPVAFVLSRMLHLGTEAFYRAVTDLLSSSDVLVAEGSAARLSSSRPSR
jgi:hypothetical protein